MIKRFVSQKTVEAKLLQYHAGKVSEDGGQFIVSGFQQGAAETFSIGQPVYDTENNLMGYLKLGVWKGLDYGERFNGEYIPSERYEIGNPTQFCINGKKVITYWQRWGVPESIPETKANEEKKRYGDAWEDIDTHAIKEAEDRLLECSFCGSKALINYIPPHTHGGIAEFMPDCEGKHFIECSGCTCAVAGGSDLENAVALWNMRVKSEKGNDTLWHGPTEKPQEGKLYLCNYGVDNDSRWYLNHYSGGLVEGKWAYLDEMLLALTKED